MKMIKLICALLCIVLAGISIVHGEPLDSTDAAWINFAWTEVNSLEHNDNRVVIGDLNRMMQDTSEISTEATAALENSRSQSVSRQCYDAKTDFESGLVELAALHGVATSTAYSDPGPDVKLVIDNANMFLEHARGHMSDIYAASKYVPPSETDLSDDYGNTLFEMGNFEEALSYYNKSIILSPNDTNAIKKKKQCLDALEAIRIQNESDAEASKIRHGDVALVSKMIYDVNKLDGGDLAPITGEVDKNGTILINSPGTPSPEYALECIIYEYANGEYVNGDRLNKTYVKGDLYIHIQNGKYMCKRAWITGTYMTEDQQKLLVQRVTATRQYSIADL